MAKREATDDEIVQWAIENPVDPHPVAGVSRILRNFVCGFSRAQSLRDRAREIAENSEGQGNADGRTRHSQVDLKDDTGKVVTRAEDITTVADALEYAEVDTSVWGVERSVVNKWDMGYKNDANEADTKALWQVKVWLRRKSALDLGIQRIIEHMPDYDRPRCEAPDRSGRRMLEVAFYDHHFSMLAWRPETGQNYDLQIARRVWNDAVAQTVRRNENLEIAQVLLPVGNDFVHINDPSGETPRSGNRLDVDSRLAKIIEQCEMALVDAVEALKDLAPVKVVWIPGNHDPQTSYYLLRILSSHYRSDARVEVDTSPKPRKYVCWGKNLIGLFHGCDLAKSKMKQLPGMMADEAADLWAPDQYREVHHGHRHKKGEMSFSSASQHGSVMVRCIPSLAATDYWHFKKGYVGGSKTAQYFLYNAEYGLEGVHDVHVDLDLYQDESTDDDQ